MTRFFYIHLFVLYSLILLQLGMTRNLLYGFALVLRRCPKEMIQWKVMELVIIDFIIFTILPNVCNVLQITVEPLCKILLFVCCIPSSRFRVEPGPTEPD